MSGTTIDAAILRHAELQANAPAVIATGFEPHSYRELRDYLATSRRVRVKLPSTVRPESRLRFQMAHRQVWRSSQSRARPWRCPSILN
jgi:hypothetical protein